ncbi:MAG TPA: enoyl-CoA hydratase/isomerase family protein, partial [Chloroflexota bacterium]|nr:enoyl-CoA hydratase/isomerase family protein [Chloroflexota bacterium]
DADRPCLVAVEDRPHAIVASLARPEKCNAISLDVIADLEALVRDLHLSRTTRPFVLRGSGRWFSSGGDLRQFAELTSGEAVEMADRMAGVLRGIEALPGPTVAALNGPAIGGGVELALAFDLRVAVDSAYLHFAETRMGIITGWQGVERLSRLVGYSVCLSLMLTASRVPAGEARRLGLVNAVWPAETFDAELNAFTGELVAAGPAGLAVKQVLRRSQTHPGLSSGEMERELLRALWDRPQRQTAMRESVQSRNRANVV